jgi:hypothetical protein
MALEREIEKEELHPSVDELRVHELKRRKLVLKDEIAKLRQNAGKEMVHWNPLHGLKKAGPEGPAFLSPPGRPGGRCLARRAPSSEGVERRRLRARPPFRAPSLKVDQLGVEPARLKRR